MRPIEFGVDDEQRLSLADIGALFEHHLFEEALDAGADFDELLGADASDVFAVKFYIVGLDGFDLDHRPDGFCGLGTQPPPQPSGRHDGGSAEDDPGASVKAADPAACLFAQFQRAASCQECLLSDFITGYFHCLTSCVLIAWFGCPVFGLQN